MKKWRRKGRKGERYKRCRQKYRMLCERRKGKENLK